MAFNGFQMSGGGGNCCCDCLIWQDAFTVDDGSLDENYEQVEGTWAWDSNAVQTADSDAMLVLTKRTSGGNSKFLEALVYVATGSPGDNNVLRLVFGYADADDHWYAEADFTYGSNGEMRIVQVVSGTPTTRAELTNVNAVTAGGVVARHLCVSWTSDWVVFAVEYLSSNRPIRALVDYASPSIAGDSIGLATGNIDNDIWFDQLGWFRRGDLQYYSLFVGGTTFGCPLCALACGACWPLTAPNEVQVDIEGTMPLDFEQDYCRCDNCDDWNATWILPIRDQNLAGWLDPGLGRPCGFEYGFPADEFPDPDDSTTVPTGFPDPDPETYGLPCEYYSFDCDAIDECDQQGCNDEWDQEPYNVCGFRRIIAVLTNVSQTSTELVIEIHHRYPQYSEEGFFACSYSQHLEHAVLHQVVTIGDCPIDCLAEIDGVEASVSGTQIDRGCAFATESPTLTVTVLQST